jgi:ethanolamine utilization protein EutA
VTLETPGGGHHDSHRPHGLQRHGHGTDGSMTDDPVDGPTVEEGMSGLEPDTLELTSAGIDIGSATCHLVVSRIVMKRMGKAHSSRYVPVKRTIEYQSPIGFTPYEPNGLIDADRLSAFLRESLDAYGGDFGAVDSGVVILTGEALRRRNARAIADQMSALAGDFVCASAGDLFEAAMAAWGSGAVERSRELGPTLNVDIGGGTTKVSLCVDGRIVARSALRVGSRLVVVDDEQRLVKVDEPVGILAGENGGAWVVGQQVTAEMKHQLARSMVAAVEAFLGLEVPDSERYRDLWIAPPPELGGGIKNVVFSSGLAEYLYGNEHRDFNDLAIPVADIVRARLDGGAWPWTVLDPPSSAIRATVTGLSQQTVEMSGDTVHVGSEVQLPWRNAHCVAVDAESLATAEEIADAMEKAASSVEITAVDSSALAWAVRTGRRRDYQRLKVLAEGIALGASRLGQPRLPVFLSEDMGRSVGRLITEELELHRAAVVLDGVQVMGGEFVDIGCVIEPNATVPVIVKSLLFGELSPLTPSGVAGHVPAQPAVN